MMYLPLLYTTIQRKVIELVVMASNKQQVNFRIDTDLLEALKQRAEIEGASYTDLIQKFCRQGLEGSTSSHNHSTIQAAIQSADNTIQPTIQPDILKEQIKAELRSELNDGINAAIRANLDDVKAELLGE